MDSSNWRPTQPEPAMEGAAGGGDWRTQLPPESRQRIVKKIMETLKRHLPCSGQEGLQELKKIAIRFEEKIYSAATSQSDYLRKISLKMLTMESKSQNPMPNALPPNSSGMSRNPQDSAPQNMQSQVQNQVQSLGMPMAPTQSQVQGHQQLLAHNMQNNISSAGMQNSSTLSSTLPPVSGLTQNSMPNVAQNSNIQNIAGITQNSIGNSMGQGSASSVYTNVQRQMQGRQHAPQGGTQQQSQQSQSQQQYMYQQQLQQQRMKQKLHPGNMQQPLLQPHIQQLQQQQNLLQPAQLQSPQQSVMQTSTVMQPPMVPSLQQNQQASIQQQPQSVYQQHQQSSSRQQQQSQQAPVHQQPNQMSQQPMIQMQQQPLPPQQQILGQQPNAANVQQSPLMGQQNSIPDMQQQRLLGQLTNLPSQQHNNHQNLQQQQSTGQQNNLSNMHQQQLGHQSQQLSGAQSGNSVMQTSQHPTPIVQQSKVVGHQQTQSSSGMVPGGGQQPQQQLMTQIQSQPTQLQQPLGHQQQSNLQHNMQQRLQTPNSLLQQQNIIDQQKQMFQSQRGLSEAPSTSLDSTAQTSGAGDCQEEVYQKIKTMKDMYFADLNEFYQKISMKLQQVDSHPQQPKMENLDKLRLFKQSLERMMHFLQLTKSSNLSPHKDRLALIEKQIVGFITSNRPRRPVSSLQQGQLPPPHQSMQHMQPPHPQASQAMPHETGLNSQVQSLSSQGPGSIVPSLQQGSVPAISGITSSQQNMISSMQSTASLDPLQGNAMGSKQQAAMGSLQQNPVGASQQASINSLPAQSGNLLHSNVSSLQSNSNMFQQHKQHEQHIMQTQQLKQQFQQRQIQQQLFQKQQQQQHQHPQLQQIKQQQLQQPGQMQSHQNSQLHPMNDVNDIKVKPGISLKSGVFQQHLLQGQRYSHQQLKPGASFPISSPQVISSVCPQINQHSSPHIDQQNLLPSMTKVGTPSQSANSPFPSPSTPLAPSPMPGDYEKFNSSGAPLSSAANISHQQTTAIPTSASSLAIGTPGISASPLLAEFTVPDGNIANTLAVTSGKSGIIEQPIERLLKAMKSISSKSLGAAVSDIGSVVNVMDRIAGSAPGNGSRATVGEDLVAMTKCRLQARSFITQDGSNGTKKMRRYTSAMPLNFVSSAGSVNDNCLQLTGSETAELESTATSNVKRPKVEANPSLLEEIREINERLIDTVVAISGEDIDPTITAVVAKGGEGTIVKCSYIAVALSPDFKVLYASRQMSQIQPLRLLVPANYPNCSPILLDKFPVEVSKEVEDLSAKAKSRFSISLRALSQPMSIKDIARTWDACTRAVMCEYAEKRGGGTFSSKYGGWEDVSSWEDVLTAA